MSQAVESRRATRRQGSLIAGWVATIVAASASVLAAVSLTRRARAVATLVHNPSSFDSTGGVGHLAELNAPSLWMALGIAAMSAGLFWIIGILATRDRVITRVATWVLPAISAACGAMGGFAVAWLLTLITLSASYL